MSPSRTHTGDDGSTGLLGEGRLPKYHPRIETLGALDEASAALGLARALTKSPQTNAILKEVQRDLYALMAEAAATDENVERFRTLRQAQGTALNRTRLEWLESQVQALEAQVPAPSEFILPGDSLPGAAFSLARTVVRRAERRVAELARRGEVTNDVMLPYLNRLSTLCFLLELDENQSAGQATSLAKK
ncbi:MAG: cob(I)yrinic acid a,c-diamide adenosyltransferase [Chloroflexota bacterium]